MIKLFKHQVEMGEIIARDARHGFWIEPGCGKTIGCLAALDASKAADKAMELTTVLHDAFEPAEPALVIETTLGAHTLPAAPYLKTVVICPKAVMRNAWEQDAEHFPNMDLVVCWDKSNAKRLALIATPADILVMNFEMFKKHTADLLNAGVKRLIIDESSKIKNHESKISKAAVEFSDQMESVYCLSGTPAPNNYTEIWPQMRTISKSVYGDSFYRFTGKYFHAHKRDVRVKGGAMRTVITGYTLNPKTKSEWIAKLKSKSIAKKKKDCLDLPEATDVFRSVEFSAKEAAAYNDVIEELRLELVGGENIAVKAEALTNKLRQLCGGWMYTPDNTLRIGRSKLNALDELLDELKKQQVVIWGDFKEDLSSIADLIESRGESCVRLDGSFKGDHAEVIKEFQAGRIKRLACHPASAGHGITLTAASHAIYFTLPWSFELYQQSKDRIHRAGQKNHCTYHHLMVDRTMDGVVYKALKGKQSRSEAIMEATKHMMGTA